VVGEELRGRERLSSAAIETGKEGRKDKPESML